METRNDSSGRLASGLYDRSDSGRVRSDPLSAARDALTIRRNATTDVTAPEWKRGTTRPEDSPAAYTIDQIRDESDLTRCQRPETPSRYAGTQLQTSRRLNGNAERLVRKTRQRPIRSIRFGTSPI